MSKIKNAGLDQYGVEPFEQQQFGTADVEGVKAQFYSKSETNIENCSAQMVVLYVVDRCALSSRRPP